MDVEIPQDLSAGLRDRGQKVHPITLDLRDRALLAQYFHDRHVLSCRVDVAKILRRQVDSGCLSREAVQPKANMERHCRASEKLSWDHLAELFKLRENLITTRREGKVILETSIWRNWSLRYMKRYGLTRNIKTMTAMKWKKAFADFASFLNDAIKPHRNRVLFRRVILRCLVGASCLHSGASFAYSRRDRDPSINERAATYSIVDYWLLLRSIAEKDYNRAIVLCKKMIAEGTRFNRVYKKIVLAYKEENK